MAYISNFSSESILETNQNKLNKLLINYFGRIIEVFSNEENETLPKNKIDDLSKSFFESPESQDENANTSNSSPLLLQTERRIKIDREFDFLQEISEISKDSSIKDMDTELASRFWQIVNPHQIPDGHCASCAFNTHLHLIGEKLEEGREPGGNYKEFGDWFYGIVFSRFEDNIIESDENETYGTMKERTEQRVKELTEAGEAVLISISDGTHWFNAYNDGTKIWFIDSQAGKGFNLYDGKEKQTDEIINDSQTINIIHIKPSDISAYKDKFMNK